MLRRIFRSIKARSFQTSASGWYHLHLADPVAPPPLPGDLEFRVLEAAAREPLHHWLSTHRKTYPWVYNTQEMASARSHHHCYPVLLREGHIVGFIKLARGRVFIHDFECEVPLPSGVALIYDTFIDPELRGTGLGSGLITETAGWWRDQGGRSVLCHIEDWNASSVRAFSKAGFRRFGTVRYLRLGCLRRWLVDGSPRGKAGLARWLEDRSRYP